MKIEENKEIQKKMQGLKGVHCSNCVKKDVCFIHLDLIRIEQGLNEGGKELLDSGCIANGLSLIHS